MDDLTCRYATRYHNLRSALWSALGLPREMTDAELVAAVQALKQDRDFARQCLASAINAGIVEESGEGFGP